MKPSSIVRLAAAAVCGALLGCGPAAPKAPVQAATGSAEAPRAQVPEPPAVKPAAPSESRPAPETKPASESQPAAESQPASRRSADVPEGSKDPVVDGFKTIIREMMLTGLDRQKQPELAARLVAIFEVANLGDDGRRRAEAQVTSKTLLDAQDAFRPKNFDPRRKTLTADDENKARAAAEALAKDAYVRLQPMTGSKHAMGQHPTLRAAATMKLPEGYEGISWKTLGGFEYTEHMALPHEVLKLNGQKVGLTGYMMTIEEVENIHEFLLVEAFWSCCFGTPPNVHQVVLIQLPKSGKGVEYTSQPVLILGTLEVGERIEDGFVTSVYRLKATSVTQAE